MCYHLPSHHVYVSALWLRGGCLHQRLQQEKHSHQRGAPGESGPHRHWNQLSGEGEQPHRLVCHNRCSCWSVSMFNAYVCLLFLDPWEGFHFGNPAGPAGRSRWGGAGVRSRALLCSCSRLQLCLEVEDQRQRAGDQIERSALSSHQLQCHLNRCTWGLLLNCVYVDQTFMNAKNKSADAAFF